MCLHSCVLHVSHSNALRYRPTHFCLLHSGKLQCFKDFSATSYNLPAHPQPTPACGLHACCPCSLCLQRLQPEHSSESDDHHHVQEIKAKWIGTKKFYTKPLTHPWLSEIWKYTFRMGAIV